MAEPAREHPRPEHHIILPYCGQVSVGGHIAAWVVDQLRAPDAHGQNAAAFKDQLLTRLNATLNGDASASVLVGIFQNIHAEVLYHEMLLNVNGYLTVYELLQLEHSLPNLFNGGILNTTLATNAFHLADGLRHRLLRFLNHWKIAEVTGSPLSPRTAGLPAVKSWYNQLFGQIWNILQGMTAFGAATSNPLLTHVRTPWENLAKALLNDGFLVEKQPPQVLRTKTQYQVSVRHLVGECLWDALRTSHLKVAIISDFHAQNLIQDGRILPERSCGHLVYEEAVFELDLPSGMMRAAIKNLHLNSIVRGKKGGHVLEGKFALLFHFSITSGGFTFEPWVLSVPMVVNVHSSQEISSWATIAWDNAAFCMNQIPFSTPRSMPWNQLANTLNRQFVVETGRALTEENLQFLCRKATRGADVQTITWHQFCKEPLPGQKFTFWNWYYMVLKLVKEHLLGPWQFGLVFGFISKQDVEQRLSNRQPGTFLLRFSDSQPGGLTIAYVKNGGRVLHVEPFTADDMTIKSLASSINDLSDLRFLYPDVPKAEAFGSSTRSSVPVVKPDGYIPKERILVVKEPSDHDECHNAGGPSVSGIQQVVVPTTPEQTIIPEIPESVDTWEGIAGPSGSSTVGANLQTPNSPDNCNISQPLGPAMQHSPVTPSTPEYRGGLRGISSNPPAMDIPSDSDSLLIDSLMPRVVTALQDKRGELILPDLDGMQLDNEEFLWGAISNGMDQN